MILFLKANLQRASTCSMNIEEGAPDTELDHHRGRNPDVFEDDYLPMTKKKGVTHKAMGKKKAGGSY